MWRPAFEILKCDRKKQTDKSHYTPGADARNSFMSKLGKQSASSRGPSTNVGRIQATIGV